MRRSLPIIIFARTTMNIALRIVYPFLPAIARGLGIPLPVAGQLIALRNVAGFFAPITGPLADRYGRRRIMEAGLLALVVSCLVLVFSEQVWLAALAFLLSGVAKALYDPAMLAYIGDRVPYERRGRVIGLGELAWSASWLLGVPATGFLMEEFGWRAPWFFLAILGLIGWLLTVRGLPPARLQRTGTHMEHAPSVWARIGRILRKWARLVRSRNIIMAMITGLGTMAAMEMILIVYGAFLEVEFGLSLTALGVASIAIGVAEAIAEFGVVGVVDRLGKRRSMGLGLVLVGVSFLILPYLTGSLIPALLGVAFMILWFEFAFVSYIPLVSELAPEQRADMLSINVAVMSLARVVGAVAGSWLWQFQSIGINTSAALVLIVIALAALSRTQEGGPLRRTAPERRPGS